MATIKKRMTYADLEDLTKWLATKQGNYEAGSVHFCLVAQYMMDRGYTVHGFRGPHVIRVTGMHIYIPAQVQRIAYSEGSYCSGKHTFKEAHVRAQKELANFK